MRHRAWREYFDYIFDNDFIYSIVKKIICTHSLWSKVFGQNEFLLYISYKTTISENIIREIDRSRSRETKYNQHHRRMVFKIIIISAFRLHLKKEMVGIFNDCSTYNPTFPWITWRNRKIRSGCLLALFIKDNSTVLSD